MGFEDKATWRQRFEITGAPFNLEDAVTAAAAKVMMVGGAGALIARRFTREFDRHQPPTLNQRVDGPVHRRDAQPGNVRPTRLEHLGRPERPRRTLEYVANRIALLRVAFHPPNMLRFAAMTRPWLRWLMLSALLIGVAHIADHTAWSALRMPTVYEKDWGRLLRSMGYLPTWGAIALAYWLQQRGAPRAPDAPSAGRVAGYLVLSPTLGGALAELLKICFRRLRPDELTFGYALRPYSDHFWSNKGMGLPSSHVLVAFAGAAALSQLFPRARWVFYGLAGGCALTRVMANAHFLSDTVVAACLGVAVGALLATRLGVRRPLES